MRGWRALSPVCASNPSWGFTGQLKARTRVLDILCLLSQKAYSRVLIYVAVHVSCNSDYTTHPWGRRRIYILFGGLLSIAGLIGEYKSST
jgi:hypothetical protein